MSIQSAGAAAFEIALGGWLFVAAYSKWSDLPYARGALSTYSLVPSGLETVAAPLLATAEMISALLLLTGYASPIGLIAAAALLVVFSVAIATDLVRGRRHSCGCGGSRREQPITWSHVVRNVAIAVLALATAISLQPIAILNRLTVLVAVAAVGTVGAVAWQYRAATRAEA
jgi:hypothetical protein